MAWSRAGWTARKTLAISSSRGIAGRRFFFFLTAAGGGVGGGAAIGGAGGTARWAAWYLRTMRSNSSWAKAISLAKDNPVGFSKSVFLGNSIMCAPSFGLLRSEEHTSELQSL